MAACSTMKRSAVRVSAVSADEMACSAVTMRPPISASSLPTVAFRPNGSIVAELIVVDRVLERQQIAHRAALGAKALERREGIAICPRQIDDMLRRILRPRGLEHGRAEHSREQQEHRPEQRIERGADRWRTEASEHRWELLLYGKAWWYGSAASSGDALAVAQAA